MILVHFFLLLFGVLSAEDREFISTPTDLKAYYDNPKVVLVASTGRSGSTLLTRAIEKSSSFVVLKTHLLPPKKEFSGKVVFIFSNPDLAAESALHKCISSDKFGTGHFAHMETSDQNWLKKIGSTQSQTLEDNLLSYDALGCFKHLEIWLQTGTESCSPPEAQILAVKYENLWDEEIQQTIKKFLNLDQLKLPAYKQRGCKSDKLTSQEADMRKTYNLGTEKEPVYAAYDKARVLWERAPAYQFLKIK